MSRLAACLVCFAIGCGPTRSGEPPPAAPSQEADLPPAAPAARGPVEVEADPDEVVARALDLVSRLRELPAKGPVKGKTVDRRTMVEHVKQQIRREIPASAVRANQEMLFALGVVRADFDYEASLLALMTSQLAGFYEPKDKTMYLAADLGEVERSATLAHELVHALQDQHYDLGKHTKYRDDATDEQSAVHALAEGDATSAMLDQLLAPRGARAIDMNDELISLEARGAMEMAADTATVPSIIKRSLVSPYVDGIVFVHHVRRQAGWAGVDAAWKRVPKSTEQILHPDKFISDERPESVDIPASRAPSPKEKLYHDVLGEQSLRLLFEEWMPRRAAVTAASDWAGDRVAVYGHEQRFALAWRVRWDTEDAARRGAEAFARGVLRKETSSDPVPADEADKAVKSGELCRERAARGPFAIVRRGREVAIVAGPFERTNSGAKSVSRCPQALAWARAVVTQK